jgi:hypothetical protein
MSRLEGRIALVTGGSRGIGAAVALRLARDGADVAITYARSSEKARAVVDSITVGGRRAIAIAATRSRNSTRATDSSSSCRGKRRPSGKTHCLQVMCPPQRARSAQLWEGQTRIISCTSSVLLGNPTRSGGSTGDMLHCRRGSRERPVHWSHDRQTDSRAGHVPLRCWVVFPASRERFHLDIWTRCRSPIMFDRPP